MTAYIGRNVSLLLKDSGGQYCGRLISYNHTDKKLVLSKVMCVSTQKYLPGNQTFFNDEIVADSLVVIDETKNENRSLDRVTLEAKSRSVTERGNNFCFSGAASGRKCAQTEMFHLGSFFEYLKKVKDIDEEQERLMTANMYDRRTELSSRTDWLAGRCGSLPRPTSYIIIDEFGGVFDEAVHRIESEHSIGVAFTGSNISRNGALYWIQVATSDLVYLFDVFTMGDECISRGLDRILTSTTILKVTHDCRYISDLLFHQHGINMVNIFDTQAAAVLVFRAENNGSYPAYVKSLQNLVEDHVPVLPNEYHVFKVKEAVRDMEEKLWSSRPLNNLLLDSLAKCVSYLNELKQALLKGMLRDFYIAVDSYTSELRDEKENLFNCTPPHILPSVFTKMQRRDEKRRTDPRESSRCNADGLVEFVSHPNDIHYRRDSIMHRHLPPGADCKRVSPVKSTADVKVTSPSPSKVSPSKPHNVATPLAGIQPISRGRGSSAKINTAGFTNGSLFPVRPVDAESAVLAHVGEQVAAKSSSLSTLRATKTCSQTWLEPQVENLHRHELEAHPLNSMGLASGFQNVELMGVAPLIQRRACNGLSKKTASPNAQFEYNMNDILNQSAHTKSPVPTAISGAAHHLANGSKSFSQENSALQPDVEWDD